jgi:NADH-quinone oxidoreductase subunit J
MGQAVAFYVLSALILGFAVMVVSARNTVHCVLFLVLNFLFVAALYVLLGAEFVAVIQILVYAGGIVVLYLFVVMLVNLKRPPEAHSDPRRRSKLGFALAVVVLAQLAAIAMLGRGGVNLPASGGPSGGLELPYQAGAGMGNTEQVGLLLYTDYLIPFEVASILLLVAMIGAIVLTKKEI